MCCRRSAKSMTILRRVTLNDAHVRTLKTRHYRRGVLVPKPALLQIVQMDGDSGFNLIHYDAEGVELTDTYHSSLSEAMRQAEREFVVRPEEWETVES